MDAKRKGLINSSSGGSFEKLRLSKAKIVQEKLLNAKREYEDAAITPSQEEVKSTPSKDSDSLLQSRVDKLEEILQSVVKSSRHPTILIQAYFQADQVSCQSTGEDWNSSLSWYPEGQAEVYQLERQHCGGWSRAEEYSTFSYHAEPYPIPTQTPTWPMEYPNYQPYPEFQSHEFKPPACQPDHSMYQPDHSSPYTSSPSHPYQTHSSETGDFFPTWSDKDWQAQNTQPYSDQICPDQSLNQPHPQQSLGPTSEEDYYANSTEGEIEGLTVFQPSVQHYLKTDEEIVMDVQHSYEEQQSHVDDLIRQVALLTEMLKEIQENRARSEEDGNNEEEEGPREAEDESPANEGEELEALLEEAGTGEIESDEEEMQTEEESITTPPKDEALQEVLEEAKDEPREKEEEVIPLGVKLDNTLFYLQSEGVHVPSEKVAEFTTMVRKERTLEEKPPPKPNKFEGSYYQEEGPEPKEEG